MLGDFRAPGTGTAGSILHRQAPGRPGSLARVPERQGLLRLTEPESAIGPDVRPACRRALPPGSQRTRPLAIQLSVFRCPTDFIPN